MLSLLFRWHLAAVTPLGDDVRLDYTRVSRLGGGTAGRLRGGTAGRLRGRTEGARVGGATRATVGSSNRLDDGLAELHLVTAFEAERALERLTVHQRAVP